MVLVGIKSWKGKEDKDYCILYVERDFVPKETNNAVLAAGKCCEQLFVDKEIANSLSSKDVGKKIVLDTISVNGKAYVQGVTVVA